MKFLFITEFFSQNSSPQFTGGVEARTWFIINRFKTTHQIKVVSRSRNFIPASSVSIFSRIIFQLTAVFRGLRVKADLVEGSNFVSYVPAFIIGKIKGIPAVSWWADVYQKDWFRYFPLPPAVTGYCLEWLALKLPWSHCIAMSQSTKKKLVKKGIESSKITVIYGGVEIEKLKKLNVKKFPHPTICTLSRLVSYKRINDLIKTVALIKPRIPTIRLMIVGDGPERTRLEELAGKLEVQDNIRFFGTLPHHKAVRILKRSHIFSLPSLVEGFGLATVEALACGIPYVNSDIPATREITKRGQGGLLFTPKNVTEFANELYQLLSDKKLYQKKQRDGQKLLAEYSWKRIAKKTEALYKSRIVSSGKISE